MQSFRIDFAMNQAHEMIIDRESGIYRSDLDEIELNMLHSKSNPYLLPIDWFELDGKVVFRYKLSGMRMLLHRLQQQSLTMEQYYTLILGIADALAECKHYMLRPEGCLLDEQFIFIGEKLHDIRLAYIPMKSSTEEQTRGAGDLLSLIVRFTSYVEYIDGEGLKRVLHHLTDKKWPLEELRSTLLDLIGEPPQIKRSEPRPQPFNQPHEKVQLPELSVQQPDHFVQLPDKLVHHQDLSPHKEAFGPQTFIAKDDFTAPSYVKEETGTNKKWIVMASLVIAIAIVWRFVYFEAATKQGLFISLGLTLLLLSVVIMIWRKNMNHSHSYDEPEEELVDWRANAAIFPRLSSDEITPKMSESNPSNKVHLDEPVHMDIANPSAYVVEPTVLLGSNLAKELSNVPVVWLLRRWEGQETKLELREGSFKIGRIGEQVSYEDNASGISRLHLEIECIEGEYKAKDLGSRNGSLLNGQNMIPYKSYTLSIGDVIQLAGSQGPSFEMKWS